MVRDGIVQQKIHSRSSAYTESGNGEMAR